jgi:hypothetical protein
MSTEADNDEPTISGRQSTGEQPDSASMTGMMARNLSAFWSERPSFTPEALTGECKEIIPMFVIAPWHKPYAEVLSAPDSPNLDKLIKGAEQAIFTRNLELWASATEPQVDESVDLENAVKVLSGLKKHEQMI